MGKFLSHFNGTDTLEAHPHHQEFRIEKSGPFMAAFVAYYNSTVEMQPKEVHNQSSYWDDPGLCKMPYYTFDIIMQTNP